MIIRTVLADIHPNTNDQPSIERAAQLASATGAIIWLYLCDYLEPLTGGVFFHDDTMKAARDDYVHDLENWLEERARPLRDRGIDVRTAVDWHSPRYEAILAKADEVDADIIVRAARKRSKLDRIFLGATDWELIRKAPQPLWLVKKAMRRGRELEVLAAVDPSHPSEKKAGLDGKLVQAGEDIRKLFGGALHIFHAYNPSAAVAPVATASHHVAMPALRLGSEIIEELQVHREKQIRQLAEPAGIPEERIHLVPGDASSLLEEIVVEQEIDVVVTGAVARGRLERLLIGNTAESILDAVPCDVVVVKPDDFSRDKG